MPTLLDDVLMTLPKGGDGSGSHRTPTGKTGGGRAAMRGPLKTAETPVSLGMPIIARGVFPFPGLYSSGWPGTHGNSPVSDFQVLEFQARAMMSSL